MVNKFWYKNYSTYQFQNTPKDQDCERPHKDHLRPSAQRRPHPVHFRLKGQLRQVVRCRDVRELEDLQDRSTRQLGLNLAKV